MNQCWWLYCFTALLYTPGVLFKVQAQTAQSSASMTQWWYQGSPLEDHEFSLPNLADRGSPFHDIGSLAGDFRSPTVEEDKSSSDSPRQHCFHLVAKFSTAVNPDGVRREVITVNDRFPGPTIRVRLGDTVTIRVTNLLEDTSGTRYPTSVHFHGIEMRGTPWWDGPELVTQCPIPFGGYMDYTFTLMQCGTYWWHSHTSWQYIDGFWGFLIVDSNTTEVHPYDDEITMSVMDWHHQTGAQLTEIFHLPDTSTIEGAGITPVPDSALINGRGNANCRLARSQGLKCSRRRANEVTAFNVFSGWTYRIRVLNPSARAAFNFSIDGHPLRVIELDGVDTLESEPVDVVTIWPAQRYSFLVTMNSSQDTENFRIRADMHIVAPLTPEDINQIRRIRPLAVIHYLTKPLRSTMSLDYCQFVDDQVLQGLRVPRGSAGGGFQGRPSCKTPPWLHPLLTNGRNMEICQNFQLPRGNIDKSQNTLERSCFKQGESYRNRRPIFFDQMHCPPFPITCPGDTAPERFDVEVVLDAAMSNDTVGFVRWHFSNISYSLEGVYFPAILEAVEMFPVSRTFNPQYLPFQQDIQVVVNNLNDGGHPFHLHGHTFWVIAIGEANVGPFDPIRDSWRLSESTAIRRDTTHVLPQSWLVFRFTSDNPGTWMFHCHIHWHLDLGLGLVFVEGEEQLVCKFEVPEETRRVCEANRVLVRGNNNGSNQQWTPYSGVSCSGESDFQFAHRMEQSAPNISYLEYNTVSV